MRLGGPVGQAVLATIHGQDHDDQRTVLYPVHQPDALLPELDLVAAEQVALQCAARYVGVVQAPGQEFLQEERFDTPSSAAKRDCDSPVFSRTAATSGTLTTRPTSPRFSSRSPSRIS